MFTDSSSSSHVIFFWLLYKRPIIINWFIPYQDFMYTFNVQCSCHKEIVEKHKIVLLKLVLAKRVESFGRKLYNATLRCLRSHKLEAAAPSYCEKLRIDFFLRRVAATGVVPGAKTFSFWSVVSARRACWRLFITGVAKVGKRVSLFLRDKDALQRFVVFEKSYSTVWSLVYGWQRVKALGLRE